MYNIVHNKHVLPISVGLYSKRIPGLDVAFAQTAQLVSKHRQDDTCPKTFTTGTMHLFYWLRHNREIGAIY
jgi:hypothetical protein